MPYREHGEGSFVTRNVAQCGVPAKFSHSSARPSQGFPHRLPEIRTLLCAVTSGMVYESVQHFRRDAKLLSELLARKPLVPRLPSGPIVKCPTDYEVRPGRQHVVNKRARV